MRMIIVNDKDEVIGYKTRGEELPEDISRVSGLWMFNSNGESLIAQRALDKKYSPGKWGPAVAGTVEEGETYLSNIIKETKEELGIDITEDQLIVGKKEFTAAVHKYFRQFYYINLDLPITAFTIQKNEVEQIRWVGLEELERWMDSSPGDFTPSMLTAFQQCKKLILG